MSSTFLQDVVSTVIAPISVGAKILAPLTDPIVNRLQASGLLGGGRAKKLQDRPLMWHLEINRDK